MSETNERKKAIEKVHLTRFLSHIVDLEINQIEEVDPPDFILHCDTGKISVELTRLIDNEEMQVEQYQERIVYRAHQLFQEKYSDKLYVLVTFNNVRLSYGKKSFDGYSKEVLRRIEKVYLKHAPDFDVHSPWNKEVSELIGTVSVRSSPEFDHWQSFGGFTVEDVNSNWFESRIRTKERKSENYKGEYTERWLVFITDLGTKASTHCFSRVNFENLNSIFDKIYIYQYMPNSVTVVK